MADQDREHWSGPLEAKAYALAATQHGLVTRAQLRALGASARTIGRRIRAKLWTRFLHPGVLKLLPAPRSDWHQGLMAACLWLGSDAFVSHAAAAALHGFDGFKPEHVEVSTSRHHCGKAIVAVHRLCSISERDITKVDGIPVASRQLTLLQIAATQPEDPVDAAMDYVLRNKLGTPKALTGWLDASATQGRRGVCALRRAIRPRFGTKPKDSELERWFYKNVTEPFGLPKPIHNFVVRDANGHGIAKVDALFPEHGLAVELHGKRDHISIGARQRDSARQNKLVLAGLTPLVFWWEDVMLRPAEVAEGISRAIGRARETAA